MEAPPGLTIYNFPPLPPNWDKIGIFYVAFAAAWTTVVAAGMIFCLCNRHLPFMRVRGLPLAFGSVTFLHMYWIMAQIVYPIGGTMPIVIAFDVQYFVMGIWFPLGIALFHASNLRFLRIAKLQKRFAHPEKKVKRGCDGSGSSWLCKIRNMDYTKKVMMFITGGIIVQCLLCAGMFLACKKYHPTFGIPGTEIRGTTVPEQMIDLGRGWEWWPSVLWQFIWTWGVAPVLIWRAWGINDTMGWRAQTIGTCLAGLHATPLFLIASYHPAFMPINRYYAPSQWIHLTTMIIEIFTVFIPAYQVFRHWAIERSVRSSAKWETSSQVSTLHTLAPKQSAITLVEKDQIFSYFNSEDGDRLFTLTALNRVLDEHPTPLQEFSAYNDFSGENIAFLILVKHWKDSSNDNKLNIDANEHRIDVYNAALQIYVDFVSPRDAEFPLNLSSAMLKSLENVFEKPARLLLGDARVDPATPFSSFFDARPSSRESETTLNVRYTGVIPDAFNVHVFDEAQTHVKDLVLTNTWPKFVREMQSRRRTSIDSEFSGYSDTTIGSRLSKFVKGFA